MYFFHSNAHNCVYEILVNDFPVEQHYRLGWDATPTEFNQAMLKSGKQTLTYRLYPIGDLLGDDEHVDSLLSTTQIEIAIFRVNDHRTYSSAEDEKLIINHKSKTNEGKFIGTGLPYYEYTFEFCAQVPYENEGWSNGIDLRNINKKVLEQKVIDYYENYKKLYINEIFGELATINYQFEFRNAISKYKKKHEIMDLWFEYNDVLHYLDKEFQPLKGYQIQFYGEGRLFFLNTQAKNLLTKDFVEILLYGLSIKQTREVLEVDF